MAGAKFTAGDSHRNPPGIKNTQNGGKNHTPEPRTKSFMLQRGTTMAGMPGFIGTKANGKRGGEAQGGPGVGPKREGYIGKKGSDNARLIDESSRAVGTMGKRHLKGASEGSIHANDRSGKHGPSAGRSSPGQRMTPQAEGKLHGHGGKMEKLRAVTQYERKRGSSTMY